MLGREVVDLEHRTAADAATDDARAVRRRPHGTHLRELSLRIATR